MQGEQTKQGAGSGGPDRLAAVRARIDELGKISQQLDAARTAAKRTRLGVTIVILLIFLGFGWIWYSAVKDLYVHRAILAGEVRALMFNPESGTLKDVIDVVKSEVPVYQKELQSQFGTEWPNIRKQISDEGTRLLKVVPAKAEERIKAKLDTIAKAQEKVLLKEFPELASDKAHDIVLKNLEPALQDAVLDVLQKRVKKAEDRLTAVHDKILQLLPPENADTFEKRMRDAWEHFLMIDLGGQKQINP